MKHFDYYKPRSLDEVWELKRKIPNSRFIAGGTDLMVQIKNGELKPSALISLRSIPEFATIEVNESTRIGALTTISNVITHPRLRHTYPLLVEAARKLGSVQIRNVATIGGNLCNCSPCADMALPLLVLDAKVRLKNPQKNRDIPLNEFFMGPGESCLASDEILADIFLEPPKEKTKGMFLKKGRLKMDLAIASVAILLEMEGDRCRKARIAAGSVAPVPLRLTKVETLLESEPLSQELVEEAQRLTVESVSPITDIRGTEEYRRQIIGVYVKRGLKKLFGLSEK